MGDSLRCDIGGAAAAGLAASVWVNATGEEAAPEGGGGPRPTFTVASVLELPPLLRALEAEGAGGAA